MLRLPNDVQSLETLLGVNSAADFANRTIVRAGFSQSGVSQNNRVIERHNSLLGPYWKSYDFASSVGPQNIFENPLGPPAVLPGLFEFQPSGGEMIFSLPNALHGFFIANEAGVRLDEAPISIVSDKQQPDSAVRSGRSCMSCHQEGVNLKLDEVRARYSPTAPANVSLNVVEHIRDVYPPRTEFEAILGHDRDLYLAALGAAKATSSGLEPVLSLSNNFDAALDIRHAAAELWVSEDLLRYSPAALGSLTPLDTDSAATVKRDAFQAAFPQVVCELTRATPIVNSAPITCP
jgi:hypothetical protein